MVSQSQRKTDMVDLFSGMGGFSYALKSNYRTRLYCEIDEACKRILTCLMKDKRLEKAPIHHDVRNLHIDRGSRKRPILLTAGSPCVDVSILSKCAKGIHGSNSKLVFEIFRLLDECSSIEYVFLENSPMLTTRGLVSILREFSRRGFLVAWGIFSAREVGAPHLRRRWYCLATRGENWPEPVETVPYHDWSEEPVPRIVPKAACSNKSLMARAGALGNSIVPQCAAYAFNTLNAALRGRLAPSRRADRQTVQLSSGEMFVKPSPYLRGEKLGLKIVYEKDTFAHTAWATPTRNLWASTCETQRAARMLATQILHDKQTVEYAEEMTDSKHNVRDMNALYTVNPNFIEWMMGFHQNWTSCAVF